MWSDLNSEEKLDVKHIAVAWIVTSILLLAVLWIMSSLVYAEPYKSFEPECTDLYEHSSSPKGCP